MDYDIFISYKNDGEGNNFAARLKESLDHSGYSVYFNSHEQKAGSFPDRLKDAVNSCKDFILLLSDGCISQLKENHAVDWVREEILCARKYSLQGTTQGNGLTGGLPPVRFSM